MDNKIKFSVYVLAIIGFFMGSTLNAAAKIAKEKPNDEIKSPLGCRDVGYQVNLKVLKLTPIEADDLNSLYFLFNKSERPIKLFQMLKEESTRSLYLNHTIKPHQWAVLSTSEKSIKYICAQQDKDSDFGDIVDCGMTLKVCEYARVKFGLNNRGNLWIVDSTDKKSAVRDVVKYGIIPR
ncbi:MAG: endopeptidase IV [Legionella sp.]